MLYMVLQQFQYTFIPRLVFSLGFWLYSMGRLPIAWTATSLGLYALNMLSAFVIFSAITVFTGTVSFWTIKSEEIVSLLTNNNYGLKNYTDYPYAFTGYYPVALLLGKGVGCPALCYAPPLVAAIAGTAAWSFWKFGLRHYGSAGA